jgi:hypothetical protein
MGCEEFLAIKTRNTVGPRERDPGVSRVVGVAVEEGKETILPEFDLWLRGA